MIKLTLPPKPAKLSENEQALTAEFNASGKKKTVWKKDYITKPLLEMSHNKCEDSETLTNQKSTYMEVEHFKHKDSYPDDVVKWGNLLPSCKKCNTTKGSLDVIATPIVNPLSDFPRDHLYVKGFRFYSKDEKGKNTIKAVALNDNTHFVNPRSKMAFDIVDKLESEFSNLINSSRDIDRNAKVSSIKSILEDCGPASEYSAVVATYVLYEWDNLNTICEYLRANGYWDEDFEDIMSELDSIALPKT
ncbi:MAG: hypothetical protein K2H08_08250 [Duncaniella sp.]|nr:hypothetical protein [Duncaniella sp.]